MSIEPLKHLALLRPSTSVNDLAKFWSKNACHAFREKPADPYQMSHGTSYKAQASKDPVVYR